MNEAGWKRLMNKIRENNVVPIIGSRLLVGADGQTSLQAQIAMRLMHERGREPGEVALPLFRELNEAVSRLKGTDVPLDLYDDVCGAIHAVTQSADFAIPAPIRQLADIADFRLLVTLTPDDLLARSLKRRCSVNEIIHSPNLPTSEGKDLLRGWQERPGEVNLLYLLGKACSAPMFAIHDEDVLEYAHNVIAHGRQTLGVFLGELQQRSLLLIGCNFPEWLSRFFLRATNQKRLSENYRRSWLIEQLKPEENFSCFLSSYGGGTEILSDLSPVEFVAELHRRWMNEHGAAAQESERPAEEIVPRETMFFISYSRKTDQPRAESLYQSLLKLGVTKGEVWFDRHSIEPGQDFQRRILDGIRSCRYFLPLLSRSSNSREEAFVFKEWRQADERQKGVNRDFLFPVIVDNDFEPERYTVKPVPKWRDDEHVDFSHAPDGLPDPRLEAKLKTLLRKTRWESKPS
jgi:hypothetical protein